MKKKIQTLTDEQIKIVDEKGNKVEEEVGELVLTKPFITMPIHLWDDHDFNKYLKTKNKTDTELLIRK